MRTWIKFCGLVREEDVDIAVRLGVDAVGFVFYPKSPRFVEVAHARGLRRRLPSFVSAVGLFVNAVPETVRRTAAEVGLDVLQFHGDETEQDCLRAGGERLPFWRAVRMRGPGDLLESFDRFGAAEALLLDAFSDAYGGSGQRFDWSWIPERRDKPLILSGGLAADSVAEAIARVRPMAVDVSSGIQGPDARRKDAEKMRRFVSAVIAADASLDVARTHKDT
jgi:phosphoribosylanthranilate isomerase